jgi:hypothetical protein
VVTGWIGRAKRVEIGSGLGYEPLKKSCSDECTSLFQSRADGRGQWCVATLRTIARGRKTTLAHSVSS